MSVGQNIHNRTLPAEQKNLIFTLFSKQNNLSRKRDNNNKTLLPY